MNIPVLFMTATATKSMIEHLKHLTGFEISPSNLIWPGKEGMARRNIDVTVLLREQSIGVFKSLAIDILKNKPEKKLIVYTNMLIVMLLFVLASESAPAKRKRHMMPQRKRHNERCVCTIIRAPRRRFNGTIHYNMTSQDRIERLLIQTSPCRSAKCRTKKAPAKRKRHMMCERKQQYF
jgi:hypothetical protein